MQSSSEKTEPIKTPPKRAETKTAHVVTGAASTTPVRAKKVEASFIGYPRTKSGPLATKKCLLAICGGQRYHDGEELDTIIKAISESCDSLIVLRGGRPLTYRTDPSISDQQATEMAEDEGKKWNERNGTLIANAKVPTRVHEWKDWIASESYQKQHALIDKCYNNDDKFKQASDDYVNARLANRGEGKTSTHYEYRFAICKAYLFEELAVFLAMLKCGEFRDQFDCFAYPSHIPEVCRILFEKFVPKKQVIWLNISFSEISEPTVEYLSSTRQISDQSKEAKLETIRAQLSALELKKQQLLDEFAELSAFKQADLHTFLFARAEPQMQAAWFERQFRDTKTPNKPDFSSDRNVKDDLDIDEHRVVFSFKVTDDLQEFMNGPLWRRHRDLTEEHINLYNDIMTASGLCISDTIGDNLKIVRRNQYKFITPQIERKQLDEILSMTGTKAVDVEVINQHKRKKLVLG